MPKQISQIKPGETMLRKRPIRVCAGIIAMGVVAATGQIHSQVQAAGTDRIFHFVDEQGVPHYTNVPADARYKPLTSFAWYPQAKSADGSRPTRYVPRQPGNSPAEMPQTPETVVSDAAIEPSDR